MLNIELAEKVLKQITEYPEMHNQNIYLEQTDCGTIGCVAGWIVAIAAKSEIQWKDFANGMKEVVNTDYIYGKNQAFNFSKYAEELLGLSEQDADYLFYELELNEEAVDYLTQLIAFAKKVQS